MAKQLGARKDSKFKAISTAPSINKTPVGNSTPPLPYPVTADLSNSVGIVPNVRFNGNPAYVLNQSMQPGCKGDAAGSCKGVKSGTVSGEVKPVAGSSSVRISGKPVIREGDPCTLNGGNCPGIYVTAPEPKGSIVGGRSTANANPRVRPETPQEESLWDKTRPWVHGTLGVASFVPGLGIITGAADAGLYAAEGDMVEAGLSAASMIPGGKVVTTAGKLTKGAARLAMSAHAAEEATKLAKDAEQAAKVVKGGRDAEGTATVGRSVNEAGDTAKLKQTEYESSRTGQAKRGANARGEPPGDGVKVKGKEAGPCDHLRQGNGKGPYRGGAHSKTSKPVNDGKDSHHMPADDVSPLNRNDGPAIQMEPTDHHQTASNGRGGSEARQYRTIIGNFLKDGEWRKALAIEIRDVRDIAKSVGNPRKYNEAILEMLEYFKCLEKHGLLK